MLAKKLASYLILVGTATPWGAQAEQLPAPTVSTVKEDRLPVSSSTTFATVVHAAITPERPTDKLEACIKNGGDPSVCALMAWQPSR